jgi:SDR family mycofactocin-dependent oxidoreductase
VALITGGARGVGAATGRALADAGWRVVLVDRCSDDRAVPYPLASRADLDAAVAACGAGAVGLVADVRDQDGLELCVGRVLADCGRLDAAVAAAGVVLGGPTAWESDDALWDATLDVNLTGVWRLARAAVPALVETAAAGDPARFVAVASAAGLTGLPRLAAYTAAKHGVVGLVRAMAVELGPQGVTANAVCPGSTRTAMLEASAAVYDLASVEEFAAHQALGRLLEPEEVAAAIAWLCSPAASGVTGAALAVDGGMTAT